MRIERIIQIIMISILVISGCASLKDKIDAEITKLEPIIVTVPEKTEESKPSYQWHGKEIFDMTKDGDQRSKMDSINYKETKSLESMGFHGDSAIFRPKMTYWDNAIMGVMIENHDGTFACAHFGSWCPRGRGYLAVSELNAHSTKNILTAKNIWVYIHNGVERTNFQKVNR